MINSTTFHLEMIDIRKCTHLGQLTIFYRFSLVPAVFRNFEHSFEIQQAFFGDFFGFFVSKRILMKYSLIYIYHLIEL